MSLHRFTVPNGTAIEVFGNAVLSTMHALTPLPGATAEINDDTVVSRHRLTVPESASIAVEGGSVLTMTVCALGAPGLSAYQVALTDGFKGSKTDWLASLAVPGAEFDTDLVIIYELSK